MDINSILELVDLNTVSITVVIGLMISIIMLLLMKPKPNSFQFEDQSKSLVKETLGSVASKDKSQVINAAAFTEFHILDIFNISHNTKLFRFEIPYGKPLGLPIGRHLSVRAEIDGTKVTRAYTPTSKPDQKGYFDLLIKSYEFGKLSSYMHSLKVGSAVEIRGPIGRFKYEKNAYKCIGLIAGGTGLTPCLQVIRCVLDGPSDDKTSFILFFQNRTEEDILLKSELDELLAKHKDRLQIFYFLSNPTTTTFGVANTSTSTDSNNNNKNKKNEIRGYINQDMINTYLKPTDTPLVCLCGPSGFNECMKKMLEETGHNNDSIYVW